MAPSPNSLILWLVFQHGKAPFWNYLQAHHEWPLQYTLRCGLGNPPRTTDTLLSLRKFQNLEAPSQEPRTVTRQSLYYVTLRRGSHSHHSSFERKYFPVLILHLTWPEMVFRVYLTDWEVKWPFLMDRRTLAWMNCGALGEGCGKDPM